MLSSTDWKVPTEALKGIFKVLKYKRLRSEKAKKSQDCDGIILE